MRSDYKAFSKRIVSLIVIAALISNMTLGELFVKYNTGITSSAAVECLFSLGKQVLELKRSVLSN